MRGEVIFVERPILNNEFEAIYESIGIPPISAFNSYRHYGIDMGDGTVVHFTGDEGLLSPLHTIRVTSMDEFLKGGVKRVDLVVAYKFDLEEVAERALEHVGSDFGPYCLFRNNCEHFAFWCATGKRTSRQVFFEDDDHDVIEKAIDLISEPFLEMADAIDKLISWDNED
ncbi:lecithin retinol acyltransferase family protein [Paenibacillus validus]|uniref:lecithin retinol acyltransferase family protein n=1 Tax=Paenibacillus validus TaxID=44253 RepID=UPI003D2C7F0D